MAKRWKLTEELSTAVSTEVFSGGACNILNEEGRLLRNGERDTINDWLTEQGILFFDPQIHPETHGYEYNYELHHKVEIAARNAAQINLYEVSPYTFSGITSFEIANDHFRWKEPTVIYFSDGNPDKDDIPEHSEQGHPLFIPRGVDSRNEEVLRAHYREFVKNATHMRKYVVNFARELRSLTVVFNEKTHASDIVITPERMHAADLFTAIVKASAGERVIVNFVGGEKARDEKGNPLFLVPPFPPEMEMKALLDQYTDEGNHLRREISRLLNVSVFTRIVYTQAAAISALDELVKIKGIKKK